MGKAAILDDHSNQHSPSSQQRTRFWSLLPKKLQRSGSKHSDKPTTTTTIPIADPITDMTTHSDTRTCSVSSSSEHDASSSSRDAAHKENTATQSNSITHKQATTVVNQKQKKSSPRTTTTVPVKSAKKKSVSFAVTATGEDQLDVFYTTWNQYSYNPANVWWTEDEMAGMDYDCDEYVRALRTLPRYESYRNALTTLLHGQGCPTAAEMSMPECWQILVKHSKARGLEHRVLAPEWEEGVEYHNQITRAVWERYDSNKSKNRDAVVRKASLTASKPRRLVAKTMGALDAMVA